MYQALKWFKFKIYLKFNFNLSQAFSSLQVVVVLLCKLPTPYSNWVRIIWISTLINHKLKLKSSSLTILHLKGINSNINNCLAGTLACLWPAGKVTDCYQDQLNFYVFQSWTREAWQLMVRRWHLSRLTLIYQTTWHYWATRAISLHLSLIILSPFNSHRKYSNHRWRWWYLKYKWEGSPNKPPNL